MHLVAFALRLGVRVGLVRGAGEGLLLDDACRVIEGPRGHEALLTSGSLDIQDKTICRELLPRLDSEDVADLGVRPGDGQEALDLPGDEHVVARLAVDLGADCALSEFERQVLEKHQHNIDR